MVICILPATSRRTCETGLGVVAQEMVSILTDRLSLDAVDALSRVVPNYG